MGRLIDSTEFARQFEDFEHTAWKLEVRDRYSVAKESSVLAHFLETGDHGRPEDHARTSPWHRNVTAGRAKGKSWQRVRVVSEPLSDYIAWEHSVTRFNIEAGEDIRWLPRHHPQVRDLPELDFWFFDDRWGCVLRFDDDDVPREKELFDDPDTLSRFRVWRDIAWARAIPHSEFVPRFQRRFAG